MIGALVLTATLAAAPEAAWCAQVAERARTELDLQQLEDATALVPNTEVASKVRSLMARNPAAAREALLSAATIGCAPRADATGAGDDVRALLASDARFGGVREGDDALDRLLSKLWVSLGRFLESRGMQSYATSARAIYLSLLVLVVSLVVGRVARALWRARRAGSEDEGGAATQAAVVSQRRAGFGALRANADAALARGDAREAIALAMRALLVRLGERTPDARGPGRTPREILAALAPMPDAVRAPIVTFEHVTFARDAEIADARAFLAEVDAASSAIDGRAA